MAKRRNDDEELRIEEEDEEEPEEDDEEGDDDDDDDEGDDDEGDIEEFEEDFDAAGPGEVKIKTTSGMDTFCVVWSFFATTAAICLMTYFVLYEVYDVRMGVIPEKKIPDDQSDIKVVAFGRDSSLSNVYNYAVLEVGLGEKTGVQPGTIIYIGDPNSGAPAKSASQAWVVLMVTEEINAITCRADIIAINPGGVTPPAANDGAEGEVSANPPPTAPESGPAKSNDWTRITSLTEAAENLPLLLAQNTNTGDSTEVGQSTLKCSTAPWDQQWLIKTTEEKYGLHVRKPRTSQ